MCTSARQHKAQKEIWLVSGLQDHRYCSVKSETRRCPWVGHRAGKVQQRCSGTSLTTAMQQSLDLTINWLTPPPCGDAVTCGDAWVCHVMIAIKSIAEATALHRQKEIKADHEPDSPVLRAFRQSPQELYNSRSLAPAYTHSVPSNRASQRHTDTRPRPRSLLLQTPASLRQTSAEHQEHTTQRTPSPPPCPANHKIKMLKAHGANRRVRWTRHLVPH